jgi:hypothetical protein
MARNIKPRMDIMISCLLSLHASLSLKNQHMSLWAAHHRSLSLRADCDFAHGPQHESRNAIDVVTLCSCPDLSDAVHIHRHK